jgi:hypothetical protein
VLRALDLFAEEGGRDDLDTARSPGRVALGAGGRPHSGRNQGGSGRTGTPPDIMVRMAGPKKV